MTVNKIDHKQNSKNAYRNIIKVISIWLLCSLKFLLTWRVQQKTHRKSCKCCRHLYIRKRRDERKSTKTLTLEPMNTTIKLYNPDSILVQRHKLWKIAEALLIQKSNPLSKSQLIHKKPQTVIIYALFFPLSFKDFYTSEPFYYYFNSDNDQQ